MSDLTEPMTVRASKEIVSGIDALAAVMDRSRNYLVNQALQQYVERNAWQLARIQAGIKDAEAGKVTPAENVFEDIALKHGLPLSRT